MLDNRKVLLRTGIVQDPLLQFELVEDNSEAEKTSEIGRADLGGRRLGIFRRFESGRAVKT